MQQPPPAKPLLVIGDEADGKNLDFTAKWVPNGLSTVDARVSLTDVSHTNDPSNDFSGVTGSLAWGYRPTGKLYTRLTVLAAPGSGVTFVDFSGASTPFINNAKSSTALRMLATYQATGKIELNGFIGFENNKYADDSTTGRAVTSRIQFGAKYAATQNINMNCYFQYQARDSDTLLANSYWGNTVYCGAELLLR